MSTVLYFEDDEALVMLVTNYLSHLGYQVHHCARFDGESSIPQGIEPCVILMDINLGEQSGYQVCEEIKQIPKFAQVPVIFISGLMEENDIINAYSVGATDYLCKPVRLKELATKIERTEKHFKEKMDLSEEIHTVQEMAYELMANNSELGQILRFYEEIQKIEDVDVLCRSLLAQVRLLGLSSSIVVHEHQNKTFYLSDDGNSYPLEQQIFTILESAGRIYSWGRRTIFNYEHFSLLIRDMPINDEKRYGVLKDHLCLLLNGIDGKVRSIHVSEFLNKNENDIRITAQTICKMVLEMEQHNLRDAKKLEQIIQDLEVEFSSNLIMFNLLEEEEKILHDRISQAMSKSNVLFEESSQREKSYRSVVVELLQNLESGIAR